MALQTINKTELSVGMYVELPLAWFDHPFASAKFKIADAKTLAQVQALSKLSECQWDPDRSTLEPDPEPAPQIQVTVKPIPSDQEAARAELKAARTEINKLESKVTDLSKRIVNLMPNLTAGGELGLAAAFALADEVARDLVTDAASVMQLVSLTTEQDHYFARHTINVTALAVMVAQALGLPQAQIRLIAQGAFLHDVGITRLPTQITRKKGALTLAESGVYEGHAKIGAHLFGEHLSLDLRDIIRLHHARIDGSGYPKGQNENTLGISAQIVGLADRYDRLCNPTHGQEALTPSEAVKHLFARERRKFSKPVIDTFIKCLGVYPPGTLVGLSDDQVGVVVIANPSHPLAPQVVVYDPSVKRTQAIPLDLSKPNQPSIVKTYLSESLPAVMSAYLALSARSHYYLIASVDADVLASADSLSN